MLILGGGFGGVAVARELERQRRHLPGPIEVTLVSKTNYLLFLPVLPEAASGSVDLTHILSPLRSLLPHTRVRVETVQDIDLDHRTVTTVQPSTRREQVLAWDYLVIALGNVVDIEGMAGVAHHGLPIKTIGDALHIRNRALEMMDGAEASNDPAEREELLTFVVAGGGFSGVELAAELNAFLRHATRAYHTVSPADIHLLLLHSGDRILPELSAGLAEFAHHELEKQGVKIRLNTRLAAATAQQIVCQSGERIPTRTLVIAFGAGPNPVIRGLEVPKERGRLTVDQMLRIPGHPRVWAVGDCSAVTSARSDQPAPPTAQFALREGRIAAQNIVATLTAGPLQEFRFGGLGQLVSLGGHSAVAELLGTVRLAGFVPWLMWRGFYLFRLPGMERKVRVFLDWMLDLVMSRDLAQLNVQRTERVAMAHYEAGQVIIRQGDPADAFYVVAQGKVQVVREQSDGTEIELDRMVQGDSFGEVGLLRHHRRNATIRALTPTDVVALTGADFDLLAQSWQHLGELLQRTAQHRSGEPHDPTAPGAHV